MSLERFVYDATIERVLDGDTVDVLVDLGFGMLTRQRVRLYGVNAPESRTKNLSEKALGLQAKEFVADWFAANPRVRIKTIKDNNEKYGRLLAEIYQVTPDGQPAECLNKTLITKGLVKEWYGQGVRPW